MYFKGYKHTVNSLEDWIWTHIVPWNFWFASIQSVRQEQTTFCTFYITSCKLKSAPAQMSTVCIADFKPYCSLLLLPALKVAFFQIFTNVVLIFCYKIVIYNKPLQRMINILNFSIVNQVLALSETGCLDDLTIVCSDGTVSSNSFVLTAMFPVLRNVLETPL